MSNTSDSSKGSPHLNLLPRFWRGDKMSCQTDTAGNITKLIEVQEITPIYNPTFTLKITSRFCCQFCLNPDNCEVKRDWGSLPNTARIRQRVWDDENPELNLKKQAKVSRVEKDRTRKLLNKYHL